MDWADIIPAALIEQHRPKKGAEAYSDPEELFNPIAHRFGTRLFRTVNSCEDFRLGTSDFGKNFIISMCGLTF